jgi:NitT/TauT family transport system ATP-binding protein
MRGLTHLFAGNEGPLVAVRDIDMAVQPGAFVSLVGPSGCGKSTLLRLAAGLLTPTRGAIFLGGEAPSQVRARKGIAWMAQQPALLPWRPVVDNVRLPSLVNRQQARPVAGAEALLDMVGLADFAGAYPHTLSGGMQQRVALARTLATGAALWLMDEPFAALDELTRARLARELRDLWQQFGTTVLWVTHHLTEAVALSDRIVLLSPRPGTIQGEIDVPLPHPRDDTAPAFQALVRQARAILQQGNDHGAQLSAQVNDAIG